MSAIVSPRFRELTEAECHALLGSKNVGRIAFTLNDRVEIQPINYASDGAWIFGRTSRGTKLSALLHHPWCAFETDDVRDLFDWASVVVKGTFSILDPKIGSLHTYQRGDTLLRNLVPGSFSAQDPTPDRNVIFGVYIHEITGRASGR